ncbi:MAG TPA: polyadenylate-specific 3'-exoribonuclease AS [Micromonosporaceae bacterium]|jgi:hypothetical protein
MSYRYFYDCEFIEDGRTIDLVSIGVVDEHGREFYAISTEFDPAPAVPWVRRNVLDRLPSPAHPAWRSRARIRDDLYAFLVEPMAGQQIARAGTGRPGELELWAWYAAYDHVVLAQLWGRMPDLPREIPRFTKDLRQLWDERGRPALPQAEQRHDALVDARHNLARWRVLSAMTTQPSTGPLGVNDRLA